jgi:hypothetical protein
VGTFSGALRAEFHARLEHPPLAIKEPQSDASAATKPL